MTWANPDQSRERTADADEAGTKPGRNVPSQGESNRTGDRVEQKDGGSALTSGEAAEAIERATAAVGQSEEDEPR